MPVFSAVLYPAIGDLAIASADSIGWSTTSRYAMESGDRNVIHLCYMRSVKLRQYSREIGVSCREEDIESTRALYDVATDRAVGTAILLCGHMSWDLAALLHLVVASDGYVSNETGRAVTLSESTVSGRYVIASRDAQIHHTLVEMLKDGHEG
jgi:fructose-1,6-bisphosphatase/inositol monophosphatase family enzyme